MRRTTQGGLLAIGLLLGSLPAAAVTYDLKTDWSDTQNPNSVWRYLAGTTLLPSLNGANWGGYGFGPTFAASASFGSGFAPMIVKYNGSKPTEIDAATDDIVAHTQTNDSNQGAGNFSVVFTAPLAGVADISGLLWNAHIQVNRWQQWTVSVGGTAQATGTLKDQTVNGSSNPENFSLQSVALNAGDIVTLAVVLASGGRETNGALVGLNMTVALTPTVTVPEPVGMALLGAGLLGLSFARRRH